MNPEASPEMAEPRRHALAWTARTALALLMLLPSLSQALEFRCQLNGDVRQISVVIPGEQHLCEVSVDYESTGERKVVWHADNDSMFCSAKAYELAGKYDNKWGFSCEKWPDRDGIDELSPTQRSILDLQIKRRMSALSSLEKPLTVTTIKATASTPLDQEPGMLAVQYFLSDGSDYTEIISDTGTSWKVFATINNLSSHITGQGPVETALISTVTDGGALEVVTTLSGRDGDLDCHGKQVLMPDMDTRLQQRTPHRVVCQKRPLLSSSTD